MKTFWTNLPLTIRAAVIFCYAYAAVRILNLFAEGRYRTADPAHAP